MGKKTKHGGNFHGGGYNYTMMFVCLFGKHGIQICNLIFLPQLFCWFKKGINRETSRTSSNSLTSSGFRGHGRKETGTKEIQNGAHLSGCNCHGSSMVNYWHIFQLSARFFFVPQLHTSEGKIWFMIHKPAWKSILEKISRSWMTHNIVPSTQFGSS